MKKRTSSRQKKNIQTLEGSRKRAGSTMVEAMVAMVIFAIFTTGACKLILSQRYVLDSARDHYTAANIAKNRMELARTLDFDQLLTLNESAIEVNKNGIPENDGYFCRTTIINPMETNLYTFAVNVKVRSHKTLEFQGAGQSLNTYIAKHTQ